MNYNHKAKEMINKYWLIQKKINNLTDICNGGFAKCYEFTNMDTRRVSAAKIIDKNTLTKSRAK